MPEVVFGCEICKQADADVAVETAVVPLSARGERVCEKIGNNPAGTIRVCVNCVMKLGLATQEVIEAASTGVELKVKDS